MRSQRKKRAVVVFGTRPEVIKLAPVIRELRKSKGFAVYLCNTGQHKEIVQPLIKLFGLRVDEDLNVMESGQDLFDVTLRVLSRIRAVLLRFRPDVVIVQGDTTTTFTTSLAAFYLRIPVAHVEAGLRTKDKYAPFPEEMNRCLVSRIADFHFAPTEIARKNLLRDGVDASRIFLTGNTVVDSLRWLQSQLDSNNIQHEIETSSDLYRIICSDESQLILLTAHRRENFGPPLNEICRAVHYLVQHNPRIVVVYPVHPNPNVSTVVRRMLGGIPRVFLLDPVSYPALIWLLRMAFLVLTDSGGVQEEAPTFGKPVLILRNTTERQEGVKAGIALLVGTKAERIIAETEKLLHDVSMYQQMAKAQNPYGDGKAAERIVRVLIQELT